MNLIASAPALAATSTIPFSFTSPLHVVPVSTVRKTGALGPSFS